jgi:hypothetical protein
MSPEETPVDATVIAGEAGQSPPGSRYVVPRNDGNQMFPRKMSIMAKHPVMSENLAHAFRSASGARRFRIAPVPAAAPREERKGRHGYKRMLTRIRMKNAPHPSADASARWRIACIRQEIFKYKQYIIKDICIDFCSVLLWKSCYIHASRQRVNEKYGRKK